MGRSLVEFRDSKAARENSIEGLAREGISAALAQKVSRTHPLPRAMQATFAAIDYSLITEHLP